MELKPCPFCGATEPTVHLIDAPESAVVCDYKMGGCGADAGLFNTNGRAIEAWNTRAERTCRIKEDADTGCFLTCSECGAIQPEEWTVYYCWSCGAKVVEV